VEPGNIFKRKDSTKMATVSSDIKDVIAELDYVEIIKKDKDGNLVVKKVY
jgi:nitrate reductase NapAB chaperone NapD